MMMYDDKVVFGLLTSHNNSMNGIFVVYIALLMKTHTLQVFFQTGLRNTHIYITVRPITNQFYNYNSATYSK